MSLALYQFTSVTEQRPNALQLTMPAFRGKRNFELALRLLEGSQKAIKRDLAYLQEHYPASVSTSALTNFNNHIEDIKGVGAATIEIMSVDKTSMALACKKLSAEQRSERLETSMMMSHDFDTVPIPVPVQTTTSSSSSSSSSDSSSSEEDDK